MDELDALMADAAAADKKVSAWLLAWVFGAPKICEGARATVRTIRKDPAGAR
jgi:hypothetical protein